MDAPGRLFEFILNRAGRVINGAAPVTSRNTRRLKRFQAGLDGGGKRVYVIAMPGTLHYLLPCIDQAAGADVEGAIELVLVANGLSSWEVSWLRQKVDCPLFVLDVLPGSYCSHGQVLNILFAAGGEEFGILDHDLYGLAPETWQALTTPLPEFMRGAFAIANDRLHRRFPRTHLMYFNAAGMRRLMAEYRIGSQRYDRVPAHLEERVAELGLQPGQFLKPYLGYFDSLNLLTMMIFSEGGEVELLDPVLERTLVHIGGTSGRSRYNSDLLFLYADLRFLELTGCDELKSGYRCLYGELDTTEKLLARLPRDERTARFTRRIDDVVATIQKPA